MTEDPNKKHHDSWFASDQPHEYEYFKNNVKRVHPTKTNDQVADAILACRKSVPSSEGKGKLTRCVNERLS